MFLSAAGRANSNTKVTWTPFNLRKGSFAGGLKVKFDPEPNYSGEFEVDVFGWSGDSGLRAKDISSENITFTIRVWDFGQYLLFIYIICIAVSSMYIFYQSCIITALAYKIRIFNN